MTNPTKKFTATARHQLHPAAEPGKIRAREKGPSL